VVAIGGEWTCQDGTAKEGASQHFLYTYFEPMGCSTSGSTLYSAENLEVSSFENSIGFAEVPADRIAQEFRRWDRDDTITLKSVA
jgi:hypothetical protein